MSRARVFVDEQRREYILPIATDTLLQMYASRYESITQNIHVDTGAQPTQLTYDVDVHEAPLEGVALLYVWDRVPRRRGSERGARFGVPMLPYERTLVLREKYGSRTYTMRLEYSMPYTRRAKQGYVIMRRVA